MSRIIFFLLALFSPLSHAFKLSDAMIDAEVRKVNNFVSADSNGIKVNVTGKGYKASAPYFQTNTIVPKTTFMGHVKGNLSSLTKKNAWYAGWFVTVGAAGWAIDELHNQMTSPPALASKNNVYCWGSPNGPYGFGCTYIPKDAAFEQCRLGGFRTCGSMISFSPVTNRPGSFLFQFTTNQGDLTFQADPTACSPTTSEPYLSYCNAAFPSAPVSDNALYDSLMSEMMKNPTSASQAFMQPGAYPYPYPNLFPDPLKYIPGVSEADYPLLDCFFKGALQSTNPSASCYATQSEVDRITSLGNQIKVTTGTGGQLDQANDELSKPLTQAQLEESLNKLKDADVSKITDDASKIYDEGFKQLNDSILADTLPGMPDLIPLPQFQTGSCRSITFQFSFAGKSVTKQFPGDLGCVQLEKMKEFLGWLMAIAVTIGLMFAALREAN